MTDLEHMIAETALSMNMAYLAGMKQAKDIHAMSLEEIVGFTVGKFGRGALKGQLEALESFPAPDEA